MNPTKVAAPHAAAAGAAGRGQRRDAVRSEARVPGGAGVARGPAVTEKVARGGLGWGSRLLARRPCRCWVGATEGRGWPACAGHDGRGRGRGRALLARLGLAVSRNEAMHPEDRRPACAGRGWMAGSGPGVTEKVALGLGWGPRLLARRPCTCWVGATDVVDGPPARAMTAGGGVGRGRGGAAWFGGFAQRGHAPRETSSRPRRPGVDGRLGARRDGEGGAWRVGLGSAPSCKAPMHLLGRCDRRRGWPACAGHDGRGGVGGGALVVRRGLAVSRNDPLHPEDRRPACAGHDGRGRGRGALVARLGLADLRNDPLHPEDRRPARAGLPWDTVRQAPACADGPSRRAVLCRPANPFT